MSKQGDIEKGIKEVLFKNGVSNKGHITRLIIESLHSHDVVIKVEDWLPVRSGMTCTVKPLIEVK